MADGFRPAAETAASDGWRGSVQLRLIRVQPAVTHSGERTRRLLNVMVAVLGLILLSPLMLLIAIGIKLTSRGPVFYRQPRVGLDRRQGKGGNWRRSVDHGGKLFTIYKFRTMYQQPANGAPEVWAAPGDPRVTRLGKVLRKYRLDELPQLYNVIRGDMNVVGPRPEQPKIFVQLRDQIDRYAERQRVLPGITGWAQIQQAYDRDLDDVRRKVHLDLEYATRVSALEDLKILARTLPVVVLGKGGW